MRIKLPVGSTSLVGKGIKLTFEIVLSQRVKSIEYSRIIIKNQLTFVRHFPEGINTRGGHVPGERPHPDASPEQRFDGQTQPECALRYSTHGADCLKPG